MIKWFAKIGKLFVETGLEHKCTLSEKQTLPTFVQKNMLAVSGTYENGKISLDNQIPLRKKMRVIVTFVEELTPTESTCLNHSDFSFIHAREKSKRFKSILANSIIEDRRSEV